MKTPKVGDECKADPCEEGKFLYGKITRIEDGLAYSDLDCGDRQEFCGDLPTRKEDGVWVFDGFLIKNEVHLIGEQYEHQHNEHQ
jgi:hypothetical protein